VINKDDVFDEADSIVRDEEAVGAEAIEITIDVATQHLNAYLRAKAREYEAKNNYISLATVNAMLKDLNN
jgi:hypothetical protein